MWGVDIPMISLLLAGSSTHNDIAVCNYFITVTSHKRLGVSNHRQLNCLFNNLLRLTTTMEASRYRITGLLWEESTGDHRLPLQRQVMRKSFPHVQSQKQS